MQQRLAVKNWKQYNTPYGKMRMLKNVYFHFIESSWSNVLGNYRFSTKEAFFHYEGINYNNGIFYHGYRFGVQSGDCG